MAQVRGTPRTWVSVSLQYWISKASKISWMAISRSCGARACQQPVTVHAGHNMPSGSTKCMLGGRTMPYWFVA